MEDDIANVFKLIKDVADKMKCIKNDNKTRVILIGPAGSGKSSLTNSLSSNRKLMIIKGVGNRPIIDGDGVCKGRISGTRDPRIEFGDQDLIFCDCPGFEDTEGILQEIVNAFTIDCFLSGNNVKILIVVSDGFLESRARSFLNSIERLERIFTNHDQLKSGIGLVVTLGDDDLTGEDYVEILNHHPSRDLSDIVNFFYKNKDRVFVFPKASRKDIGKEYTFEDHSRLISFLKKDPISNPRHEIALSKKAELMMIDLYKIQEKNSSDKVKAVTDKINNQFIKANNSEEIHKWIEIMEKIKYSRVRKAYEFSQIVKDNIPNCEQYDEDMKSLTEFELFDQFIDKVFRLDDKDSSLIKQIQTWAQQSIIELIKMLEDAKKIEDLKEEYIKNKIEIICYEISSELRSKKTLEELDESIYKLKQNTRNCPVEDHKDFIKFVKRYYDEFESYLSPLETYEKSIYIGSQFNIWYNRIKEELEEMKYEEQMRMYEKNQKEQEIEELKMHLKSVSRKLLYYQNEK